MVTQVVRIQNDHIDEDALKKLKSAGEIIKNGGLVAFPTETVYGLGGDALNPGSSRKIYEAKGRPSDNPLIVHICCIEDMYKIADPVPEEALVLAKHFWPGPLTMIMKKTACVPMETTGGLDTVAVRMPDHEIARHLIRYGGGFVAAPSANRSGRPSPTSAKYVIEDMDSKIDMIIDGELSGIGLESTIIDLTVSPPQILRPGFITEEMLTQVLGEVSRDRTCFECDTELAPRAPGMKYRHYAPLGEMTIVEGEANQVIDYVNHMAEMNREKGEKTGVIASDETAAKYKADVVKSAGSRTDEKEIGRRLYEILRQFDEESVTVIYSESFFSEEGFSQAIMNRLLKAAGHRVIKL